MRRLLLTLITTVIAAAQQDSTGAERLNQEGVVHLQNNRFIDAISAFPQGRRSKAGLCPCVDQSGFGSGAGGRHGRICRRIPESSIA